MAEMDDIFGPYRRWYRFGWRSPHILWTRSRVQRWPFCVRMFWQRQRRQLSDDQAWSLNHHLAQDIVYGCQKLREWGNGYPTALASAQRVDALTNSIRSVSLDDTSPGIQEWHHILRQIEKGFQLWLDEDGWLSEEQEADYNRAKDLFVQWFDALWD